METNSLLCDLLTEITSIIYIKGFQAAARHVVSYTIYGLTVIFIRAIPEPAHSHGCGRLLAHTRTRTRAHTHTHTHTHTKEVWTFLI
jgi:hypothetical protein